MYAFVVALHVVACLILVAVILLQPGKGADASSAFGGGMGTTMFGPRGPTNVLTQATTVCAVLFMITSVTLALYSSKSASGGIDVNSEIERLKNLQHGDAAGNPPPTPPSGTAPSTPSAPPPATSDTDLP